MTTPKVFIIRHGETEWSLSGKHTGKSDIPLTEHGEAEIKATSEALIGPHRLIAPRDLAHIYVSPRQRAQKTLELLAIDSSCPDTKHVSTQTTEDIAEWDYGEYEGLKMGQIEARRQEQGQSVPWDIWREGCPHGESAEQITARCDRLIADIRNRFHEPAIGKPLDSIAACNVVVVAHGHILRAFAARWVGLQVTDNPHLVLDTGAVGVLTYEHQSLLQPAIVLGGAYSSRVERNLQQ